MSENGGGSGSPTGRDPVLVADDVAVSLGDVEALRGVSVSVDAGRFVGLVGPNGAGKTTLLRAFSGAVSPASGTARVCGERVTALSSRAASRLVATVPQSTSLAFDFDVREVVAMGRTPHRSRLGRWRAEDEAAVDSALSRASVTELADRPVTAISGGERQRVLLARALAQETPVLLLDEPTASLDIAHQVRTLELVRDLTAGGKTAVAAIHDLNLAAHYCDELILLGDGAVLAAGAPERVLTESNLRAAFDANAVVSRHPVTGSTYVTALPEKGAREGRVHVVGGGGSGARWLYLLDAAGFEVTAGALNEGDTDTEAARGLGLETVTVGPYAPVDGEARERVEALIAAADAVVVADVEVGEGNLPNLEAAATGDRVVVVEERPFEERNYAGGRGRRVYDDLRSAGHVAEPSAVVGTVESLVVGASHDVDTGGPDEPIGSGTLVDAVAENDGGPQ